MFKKMYESKLSWILLSLYLFFMESFALYYQYVIGLEPCALCVQIRAAVLGAGLSSILFVLSLSFFGKLFKFTIASLTILFMSIAMYLIYISYQIEIGEVISSCTPGNAFPQWLPLDAILPSFFEAKGICGVSPEIFYGYTMNEVLIPLIATPLIILVLAVNSNITLFFRKVAAGPYF